MPSAKLKELHEERVKLVADMRSILEAYPDGKVPEDKNTEYEAMEKREEQLEKQIDRLSNVEKVETRMKETIDDPAPSHIGGEDGKSASDKEKAATEELTQRAFRAYLTHGPSALHKEEYRALSAGALTEGGSFVPDEQWVNELVKAIDDAVTVRGLARVFSMSKAASLGVPVLDADPDDADWTTELATGSEDSTMATGKRELVPHPFAKRIKVSRKLIQNSVVPVDQLVRERLAYKFSITENKGYLTGSGANQPLGLFTAAAEGIPTSRDVSTDNTTTSPTVNGLINALYSLKEGYQARSTWMFHRTVVKAIRKLRSDSGAGAGTGDYLWQPPVQAGEPETLLGRPIVKDENAPSTLTTGLYVGIIGDFSYYWIADVLQYEVQRLMELYAENNQIGYIGRKEADGMPVLAEAFARVKLA